MFLCRFTTYHMPNCTEQRQMQNATHTHYEHKTTEQYIHYACCYIMVSMWFRIKEQMTDVCVCRLKMHEEKKTKQKADDTVPQGVLPPYLLDRQEQVRAKVLSNMIKQKRKEKAVRLTLVVCLKIQFIVLVHRQSRVVLQMGMRMFTENIYRQVCVCLFFVLFFFFFFFFLQNQKLPEEQVTQR